MLSNEYVVIGEHTYGKPHVLRWADTDGKLFIGLDHATRCDGVRNQIAPRQKELDMYRVGVLTALLRLMGVEV